MVYLRQLEALETYAKENHVPIMMPEGINFLTNYIKEYQCYRILEIGAAIGYSAIKMALVDPSVHVTTIERDEKRYEEALKNIEAFHLENQITLILGDALETEITGTYDLIFIDAAKSQYIKFFNRYQENLDANGVIISDNLDFHGLTHTKEKIASRNVRQLVRKINNYITFLKENDEFDTTFFSLGDGIGVSKRRQI